MYASPPQYFHAPASWPLTFILESGFLVTCDVGYLCVNIIVVFLGLSVLELFPMYATDRRQLDRQADVRRQITSTLNAPPRGRGIIRGQFSGTTMGSTEWIEQVALGDTCR